MKAAFVAVEKESITIQLHISNLMVYLQLAYDVNTLIIIAPNTGGEDKCGCGMGCDFQSQNSLSRSWQL